MAYVGTPIDTTNQFQSLSSSRFSGNGSTTAFTLSFTPGGVNDIEVFVENVRQDPHSAYTLSGTTLTFSAAPPSGTNNIYVIHQAKSVGTIDVPTAGVVSGSLATSVLTGQTDIGGAIADADLFLVDDGAGGTLRKTASSRLKTYAGFSVSDITGATELAATPADTDEFIISDAGTLKRMDYSHIKAGNTPQFSAQLGSNQSLSNNTLTKINFNTELFDPQSTYDNSTNYRWTPAVAGNYFIYTSIRFTNGGTYEPVLYPYKNGSGIHWVTATKAASAQYINVSLGFSLTLDDDDYIEIYARQDSGSSMNVHGGSDVGTVFMGFKIG